MWEEVGEYGELKRLSGMTEVLLGEYHLNLDDKGRLSVPASLRNALHELYAPDRSTTPDYYDIATAGWAERWPVEDLWAARLDR